MCLSIGFASYAETEEAPKAPQVNLDELLILPKNIDFEVVRHGGSTRTEWLGRFEKAEQELAKAKRDLEASQEELKQEAGGENWKVAPPGMEASTEGTVHYKLRQEIKRNRIEVDRAGKRHRDLTIKANLAGVPDEWRQEPEAEGESSNPSIQP